MTVEFRPLNGSFGAEGGGVDPALELDETTFAAIEAAWYRHSILLFRGLSMKPEQQVAFTQRFGLLHIMVPTDWNLPDHPEVWVVGNAEQDGKAIGLRGAGMGIQAPDDLFKQLIGAVLPTIPLGRIGYPEDVARIITFLASDEAEYMTGQAINITGGQEMH